MFTGIVQQVGRLVAVDRGTAGGGGSLRIECAPWAAPLGVGESVAVQGACLSVKSAGSRVVEFDVLQETFEKTNLAEAAPGSTLNLERALRLGDAMGGHLLTGHVDGVGRVQSLVQVGRDRVLEVGCDAALLRGIVYKGSIACDGVSLTVTDVTADTFKVHLIPLTWANTALSRARRGVPINLETDLLGKYIERWLSTRPAGSHVTWDVLRQAGFDTTPGGVA